MKDAAHFFKALADEARLKIIWLLFHHDELCVCDIMAALGITQSMKRPRELGDNAFIESFFHSMKADAIHARTFPDEEALRHAVRRFIFRYNRSRLHSSLGNRSPIDYERAAA